jgi:hypothetical protein
MAEEKMSTPFKQSNALQLEEQKNIMGQVTTNVG